jgi:hypothetical protein
MGHFGSEIGITSEQVCNKPESPENKFYPLRKIRFRRMSPIQKENYRISSTSSQFFRINLSRVDFYLQKCFYQLLARPRRAQ